MLIEKIKVENFGPFAGTQEMNFSYDDKKNVNVIVGNSATGKTSLAYAIKWVLYGNDATLQNNFGLHPLNNLVSKNLKNDETSHVKVELGVRVNGKSNSIERQIEYKNDGGKIIEIKDSSKKIQTDLSPEFLEKILSINPALLFSNIDEMAELNHLLNKHKISISENLITDIAKDATTLLKNWDDKKGFSELLEIQNNDGKLRIMSNGHDVALAASEQILLNYIILVLVRKILFPNAFLLIDSLAKLDFLTRNSLVNFLASHTSQIILLLTETEFYGQIKNESTGNAEPSLAEIIRKSDRFGKEYTLQYDPASRSTKITAL